jgi:hypothetical protein
MKIVESASPQRKRSRNARMHLVEAVHSALPRLRHHNEVGDGRIILVAILQAGSGVDVPRNGAGVQFIEPAPK